MRRVARSSQAVSLRCSWGWAWHTLQRARGSFQTRTRRGALRAMRLCGRGATAWLCTPARSTALCAWCTRRMATARSLRRPTICWTTCSVQAHATSLCSHARHWFRGCCMPGSRVPSRLSRCFGACWPMACGTAPMCTTSLPFSSRRQHSMRTTESSTCCMMWPWPRTVLLH